MAIEKQAGDGMEVEASETVDIPTTILAGQTVAPGDVIQLEVVSSDEGSGIVTVKYAQPEEPPEGISAAAAEF